MKTFAKEIEDENVQIYTYTLDDGVYIVEKNTTTGYFTVKLYDKIIKKQKISDFQAELKKVSGIKTTKASKSIPNIEPDVIEPPDGGGGYYSIFVGDLDTCYYKVFSDSTHLIQIVEWGYDANYGVVRKYASYSSVNIANLESFKQAVQSWNNSRITLEKASIGVVGIALISAASAASGALFAQLLSWLGIGSGTTVFYAAKNMAEKSITMRNIYPKINGYSETRDVFRLLDIAHK